MKRVSEIMTRNVYIADPEQTISDIARAMADADVGSLPVGENDRLVGMVTDRDIVLRAVAKGRDGKTKVRDVMTEHIQYCYDDDAITKVADHMSNLGLRRMAVLNHDKRLVGIVTLSDIASCGESKAAAKMAKGVAKPHPQAHH